MGPQVSVCMPYWNRRSAITVGVRSLVEQYADKLNVELCICDDGSLREPLGEALARMNPIPFPIRVHNYDGHPAMRNSAAAIQAAVELATAPVVVVQNPETTHHTDVLGEIHAQVQAHTDDYVICACRDDSVGVWYEHSTIRRKGMHWCVGASRAHFQADIMPLPAWLMLGHCYEDNVLRNRAILAQLKLSWRDDLVVRHHKELQEKTPGRRGNGLDHWDGELTRQNRKAYLEHFGESFRAEYLTPLGITGE